MTKTVKNLTMGAALAFILSITGTAFGQTNVKVVNNTSDAVPIVNVNEPSTRPFQTQEIIQQTGSNVAVFEVTTVPAGKRLVIEFVSIKAQVPSAQRVTSWHIGTTLSGIPVEYSFDINPQPNFTNGDAVFRANQLVKLYADPGTTVRAVISRNTSLNSAFYQLSISGYLVDLP